MKHVTHHSSSSTASIDEIHRQLTAAGVKSTLDASSPNQHFVHIDLQDGRRIEIVDEFPGDVNTMLLDAPTPDRPDGRYIEHMENSLMDGDSVTTFVHRLREEIIDRLGTDCAKAVTLSSLVSEHLKNEPPAKDQQAGWDTDAGVSPYADQDAGGHTL